MFKLFEYIVEIIGWLQIVASPLLVGIGLGVIVYFSNPTTTRLFIGISIAVTGLLVGIIWATKVWKTKGTIRYLSKIRATPEFENENTETNTDLKKDNL